MKKIFVAKKIITMNHKQPTASCVAVDGGRILAVGELDHILAKYKFRIDKQFENKILLPGFVEGHAHTAEGTFWQYNYCGYFNRTDPQGKIHLGTKNLKSLILKLQKIDKKLPPHTPLPGWQFDPIYFGKKISRHDLDKISTTRPIGLLHASGHIMNVNTKALELANLLKPDINHPAIPLGRDGLPTGELKGPDVMTPVGIHIGFGPDMLDCDKKGLKNFAKLCVRSGTTTITDLAARLSTNSIKTMLSTTAAKNFPARIFAFKIFLGMPPKELVAYTKKIAKLSTDKLRLGAIKIIADGSIQGFSARIKPPRYFNGSPNGLWYIAPEQMLEIYELALKNNIQVHTHTNGDEATELAILNMQRALKKYKKKDHRFTLQHCQMGTAKHFAKMKKLNMCVNLFANHVFYWGEQHRTITLGPRRAAKMNACATALQNNLPLAIHSDAPITPLAPLFTAWCAVNRRTAKNKTLGAREKISANDALYAITMGAAYTLKLDKEIGSIEPHKKADFAILEQDPTTISPTKLKDIKIYGTILGGKIFPAAKLGGRISNAKKI